MAGFVSRNESSDRLLGRGTVLALARNGADVVIADVNLKDAQGVAEGLSGMGRQSMAVLTDVTVQRSVDDMVRKVIARFGRIDILVNNAATIGAAGWEQRERPNEDDWDEIYAVNLKGLARVTDAVTPHMKERRYGKIVNISSAGGRLGTTTMPPYTASKAGVINLTQSMALELAPFDVNVNAICPGSVWSPMQERVTHRVSISPENTEGLSAKELFDRSVKERRLLGGDLSAEDIGNAVAFLASDYARNITGQALNVSGGSHMN